MLRSANVATPATAVTVVVPLKVPPAGVVARTMVMVLVKLATTLPWASRAAACRAGVAGVPAVSVVGPTEKTTSVGRSSGPATRSLPLQVAIHGPSASSRAPNTHRGAADRRASLRGTHVNRYTSAGGAGSMPH